MKTLEQLQAEFVAAHVAAVRRHPTAYKTRVVADPEASAWGIIAGLDRNEMLQMMGHIRSEERALRRAGH